MSGVPPPESHWRTARRLRQALAIDDADEGMTTLSADDHIPQHFQTGAVGTCPACSARHQRLQQIAAFQAVIRDDDRPSSLEGDRHVTPHRSKPRSWSDSDRRHLRVESSSGPRPCSTRVPRRWLPPGHNRADAMGSAAWHRHACRDPSLWISRQGPRVKSVTGIRVRQSNGVRQKRRIVSSHPGSWRRSNSRQESSWLIAQGHAHTHEAQGGTTSWRGGDICRVPAAWCPWWPRGGCAGPRCGPCR